MTVGGAECRKVQRGVCFWACRRVPVVGYLAPPDAQVVIVTAAADAQHRKLAELQVAASVAASQEALRDVPGDTEEAIVRPLNTSRSGRAATHTWSDAEFAGREIHTQKELLLSTIVSAVARRLESASEEDLAHIDPKQVAERAAALIPTPHPFTQLGPFYPTRAVAKWLGLSRQALDHRVKAGKMLGCPTSGGGQRVYPVWQFTTDGHLIPHLAEVLDALRAGIDDPWTWATWLAAALPGRFDGKPAYQWLAEGRDAGPVLTEARRTASRLAH